MKKLLFLLALVIGMVSASFAQSATLMPLIAGDTVNNGGTVTKTFTATAGYSALGVQPVITKISGTVGGTAILSRSLDGVNYVNTDTLTLANVTTNTTIFAKVTTPAVYYRLVVTGTGTMAAQVRLYYVLRKHSN